MRNVDLLKYLSRKVVQPVVRMVRKAEEEKGERRWVDLADRVGHEIRVCEVRMNRKCLGIEIRHGVIRRGRYENLEGCFGVVFLMVAVLGAVGVFLEAHAWERRKQRERMERVWESAQMLAYDLDRTYCY